MSAATPEDLRWLDAAVRMAEPYCGTTAENPTVGAILVDPRADVVVGYGVTARGGRPHAEPQAIDMAGARAEGATLYCTLEPCHHWGRTPPCVDAVIRSGVTRAVIGMADPDPRTSGESLMRLRAAGIETILADHEPSRRLHRSHTLRQTLGRPFVTLKLAVSADGRIGLRDRGKTPITGEEARQWTHLQRALSSAVMIGGATAEIDDPQLTVRLPGLETRTPLRVILAGRRGIDRRLNLIGEFTGHPVAVIVNARREVSVPVSIEVIRVKGKAGRPDLVAALEALSARGITRLFVEPGAGLTRAFLAAGAIDRFELLTGQTVLGGKAVRAVSKGSIEEHIAAAGLVEVDRRMLGEDMLRSFERE